MTSLRWALGFRAKSTRPSNVPNPTPGTSESESRINLTIPGPSWLWLEPVSRPFRAYSKAQARRPYMVQLMSTVIIWFLGDLSAQTISRSEDGAYSTSRAMRSVTVGSISSIPSYRWFLYLGQSFNYSSKILSLIAKIVVNQLTFAPLFNIYFFSMHSFLSGASFEELVERVRHTLPISWLNSCKLWPAVTAFSFTFIPQQYRSIFAGCVAIGWQTWLTLLNQQAAAEEKIEHERQQVDSTRASL
ncbi:uncharacterized protein K452DRAFT_217059 [Aplosporella prunicola CBS 121167]|uniref:Mpv17/PMP22 family protein n=1 Tax=Aplosporella prunicola CBS 121167 TaxID=1176127 RepID=A0A6A6BWD4_9PEZI|nr:uncharacterized protein K452DRAFT_217059 [Aplosporella prunicola CBS 121167]KAF2147217.1 hypothetical protein K452DRAFT_217059 [Aplosporella prunicola CBS 121167]